MRGFESKLSDQTLVSIIMPAYNAEKYVKNAIESVLNQTYNNIELLISDDASSDKTKLIIDSFKDHRIRTFHNEKNLKQSKTRNKLLLESRGELIAFQDADDYSDRTRIEKQVNCFLKNEFLGLCGTWLKIISENEKLFRIAQKPLGHKEIITGMYESNRIGGATSMFRKEILNLTGGFREFFEGACEDYDFFFRISEKFFSQNIPEPLYVYRMISSSTSKQISAEREFMDELVRILGKQRLERGTDWLMERDFEKIEIQKAKFLEPYRIDPSLVYRNYASRLLYSGLWWPAAKSALTGIIKNPNKLINYRTLFYVLRKF